MGTAIAWGCSTSIISSPTTTPTAIKPATTFCRPSQPSSKPRLAAAGALYRYGGEEFLCIFPEQSMAGGTHAIERMRIGVERLAVSHADSPRGLLTVSAGLIG